MTRVSATNLEGAFGPVYREAVRDIAPSLTPDRLGVIAWSGLAVEEVVTLNYTPWPDRRFVRRVAADWPRRWFGSFREVLLACASSDGLPSG